jgi:transposase-like protein
LSSAVSATNSSTSRHEREKLNNVLEQDHRAIKRRVRAGQHFRSFWGSRRTIAGYEAIHMIRNAKRGEVRREPSSVYCTAF